MSRRHGSYLGFVCGFGCANALKGDGRAVALKRGGGGSKKYGTTDYQMQAAFPPPPFCHDVCPSGMRCRPETSDGFSGVQTFSGNTMETAPLRKAGANCVLCAAKSAGFVRRWPLSKREAARHPAMGYNASWASANASERGPFQAVKSLDASGAPQIVGINRSAHAVGTSEYEAYREEQTYRHFTTVMQVVILIGSLLGK